MQVNVPFTDKELEERMKLCEATAVRTKNENVRIEQWREIATYKELIDLRKYNG